MRKTAIIITVLLALVFSTPAFSAIPVDVTIGKSSVLTLRSICERISLADPSIADLILISPSELVLNGKKVGTTSLITWDPEGKRTFFDVSVFGDLEELRNQIDGLAPGGEVAVERAGASVLLKGTLSSEDTIEKILTVSRSYAASVINFLRVAEPEQVLLQVRVAQIDRTKLKEFGVSALAKGIDSGNAELTAPGLFATPSGNVGGGPGSDVTPGIENFDLTSLAPQIGVTYFPSGVSAVLRALATKDYAKVLAEPNLVVRSGEKGEFHVGTRVPVQQVTGVGAEQTVSIIFEEVGIRLNFAPNVLDDGTIRLRIDPAEVSNITRFFTQQNIIAPEIDTRTVRTSVDLKEGESLVLAGLLSEEMKKNIQKVPILGDIPILGALFRSTRDELEKMELAFFITPTLVKPTPPGKETVLGPERPMTPEEQREFDWIPVPGRHGSMKAEPEKGSE